MRLRVTHWPSKAGDHVARLALRLLARPSDTPVARLGSEYGGWWVPEQALKHGGVAYCAGAGEDITFDLALHRAGFIVRTFDPTPRAVAHVKSTMPNDDRFTFHPIGWWNEPKTLKFFAPKDPRHVSHSATNLQKTGTFFEAPVDTVMNLMTAQADTEVHLIKMDIEGAESRVLDSLLCEGPHPSVLCVEFDSKSVREVLRRVRDLRGKGYRLVKVERWNYTFEASRP